MIIWFVSLVWASLIFGGHVDASHHMDIRSPQATTATTAATTSTEGSVTTPTGTYFQTNWGSITGVTLNQLAIFDYSVPSTLDEAAVGIPGLFLCQTNATGADSLDSSNTWSVTQFTDPCPSNNNNSGTCTFDTNVPEHVYATFEAGSVGDTQTLTNFFLCFGTSPQYLNDLTCESYSPFFNIAAAPGENGGGPLSGVITTPLRIPENTAVVGISGQPSATMTAPNYATISSIYITTSASSTSPAQTAIASSTAGVVAYNSKPGLSTGALVGVIVGAVGGALILALLGLLCLRRRKHARTNRADTFNSTGSQPEHVLLTQPYTSIESRDLSAEKGSPTTLASMLETPLSRPTLLPQNPRHSYDSLNASAPYSGLAAAAPKPRSSLPPSPRSAGFQTQTQNQNPNPNQPQSPHPHQHSLLSHPIPASSIEPLTPLTHQLSTSSHHSVHSQRLSMLQRGVSDASGPMSAATVSSERGGEGEEFEEYHDVPIYRDARHTATVYEGHPGLLQAPFLHDAEGMSEEEIARLEEEEEERRIDAAIAAAEATRAEGRGGKGLR